MDIIINNPVNKHTTYADIEAGHMFVTENTNRLYVKTSTIHSMMYQAVRVGTGTLVMLADSIRVIRVTEIAATLEEVPTNG